MKFFKKIMFPILSLGVVLFTQCQKDEFISEENKAEKTRVQHVDVEELFKRTDVKTNFQNVLKNSKNSNDISNTNLKTIMEDQYNFTILDQPASVISTEKITSYTLLIDKKKKETPETLCNLVVQKDNKTGEVRATIIEYVSKSPITTINNPEIKIKTQPIKYNPNPKSSNARMQYECVEISFYVCTNPHANHDPGGPGCWATPTTFISCNWNETDPVGSPGTTTIPTTTGGGGGATYGAPYITSPVINNYTYSTSRMNGGNFLNLSPSEISFLNSNAVDRLVRKFIIEYYHPESNDSGMTPSQVVNFLQNNQHILIGFNNYFIQNQLSLDNNFVNAIIKFSLTNTTITFDQLKNWFLTPTEGKDDDYDSAFWDNTSLTFPVQKLPTWNSFKNAYPKHKNPQYDTPEKMYAYVGGMPYSIFNSSRNGNTCALRISVALNACGIDIPNIPGKTFMGANGKYYFLGASNLLAWMKKTFGTPSGSNHLTGNQGGINGINFPNLLKNKKGIYVMVANSPSGFGATGHADIIELGANCDGGCYFDAQVGGVKEIFIFELP